MMGFDVINIGATANDGTGDPLRTAFDKTNDNFALAVEGATGSTDGTVALFDGTTGKVIKGGGKGNADLVVGPATATSGRVAVYDGTTGKLLQDGSKAEADLVVGPATATDGAVALYDSTTGKLLKDGPVPGAASGLATLDASLNVIQGVNNGADFTHASTGFYTYRLRGSTTVSGLPSGTARYVPVSFSATRQKLRILGINVTTAGFAGSVARIGLYGPLPTKPTLASGSLFYDAGTVEIDSTGFKTIDIASDDVFVLGWYYAVVAVENDTGNLVRFTSIANNYLHGHTFPTDPTTFFVFSALYAGGAFPATGPSLTQGVGGSPMLYWLTI
jgi:hypothetical protein